MNLKNHVAASVILLLVFVGVFSSQASAHFEHLPHYNGGGDSLGKYYVYEAIDPEYVKPGQGAHIEFSIQDYDGNDIQNVKAMVEIYQSSTEKRIELIPWQNYRTGDFDVDHVFGEIGNYQIVISLANDDSEQSYVPPPRQILLSTLDCDCSRAVFNISVNDTFGTVWDSTMIAGIILPIAIFGIALSQNYLGKKRKGTQPSRQETLKYIIMFVAVAAGVIHLGVYADHASLRLEYSIFLLVAASAQLAFGALYVFITLYQKNQRSRQSIISHYTNTKIINLIGLVGTGVLLGLYIYVVIFPPPLSPDNKPEEIEYDGVFAKAVEVVMFVGIIYLMRYEKSQMRLELARLNPPRSSR